MSECSLVPVQFLTTGTGILANFSKLPSNAHISTLFFPKKTVFFFKTCFDSLRIKIFVTWKYVQSRIYVMMKFILQF
jgi:hypothetical protein